MKNRHAVRLIRRWCNAFFDRRTSMGGREETCITARYRSLRVREGRCETRLYETRDRPVCRSVDSQAKMVRGKEQRNEVRKRKKEQERKKIRERQIEREGERQTGRQSR